MKRFWDFFKSLALTEVCLYLLMFFSAIGSFCLVSGSKTVYKYLLEDTLFGWLGRMELKSTWWMIVLIVLVVLLFINTIVCSIDRLSGIIRFLSKPSLSFKDSFIESMQEKIEAPFSAEDIPTAASKLKSVFSSSGYKFFYTESEGGVKFCARSGTMGILGPYISHLGFLFFLLAHLLSGTGFKLHGIRLFGDKTKISGVPFRVSGEKGKDFSSSLTAWSLKDGKYTKEYTAKSGVNNPFGFDDIYMYHKGSEMYLKAIALEISLPDGFSKWIPIGFEEEKTVRDGINVLVGPLIPNFVAGVALPQSSEMENPAFLVTLKDGDKVIGSRWFFPYKADYTRAEIKKVKIYLRDMTIRECVKIDVVSNPGLWWALAGGVLFLLGMGCSTFISFNRVWGTLKKEENNYVLRLGGRSSINSYTFHRKIGNIVNQYL